MKACTQVTSGRSELGGHGDGIGRSPPDVAAEAGFTCSILKAVLGFDTCLLFYALGVPPRRWKFRQRCVGPSLNLIVADENRTRAGAFGATVVVRYVRFWGTVGLAPKFQ